MSDKQKKNSAYFEERPWLWKPGQSGNILGRPKGKSMKEYARQYLERMTDEERDEWLAGIPKEKIWEMGEGSAKKDIEVDATITGPKVIRLDE
jgi:hypothetical protein